MIKNIFLTSTLLAATAFSSSAADFFDTSAPSSLLDLGLRFGINTTNHNLNKEIFNVWNVNSWGTGIDVGAVVDINFRDFISLQPGIFYESRSGKYAYVNVAGYSLSGEAEYMTQFGRDRSYNFTIPIMACLHFNLSDDIRWNVELGPYLQLKMKNTVNGEFLYPVYSNPAANPDSYVPIQATKTDFGLKFGTGLKILGHYVVSVHYEAGWLKPWTESRLGGRNKGWIFSAGYDF